MAVEWMKLPIELRTCDSFAMYKSGVYKLLLSRQVHDMPVFDDIVCDYSCIESVARGVSS